MAVEGCWFLLTGLEFVGELPVCFLSDCSPGLTHGSEHGRETAPERSQSESSLLVHLRASAACLAKVFSIYSVRSFRVPAWPLHPSPTPSVVGLSAVVTLTLSAGSGADQRVDQQVERDAEHPEGQTSLPQLEM